MQIRKLFTAFALGLGLTLALVWLLGGAPLPAVRAADINNVDTTADGISGGDGQCTLREAINNANSDIDTTGGDCTAGDSDDTITLLSGTYVLTRTGTGENSNDTGDLDITDMLTIEGAGPGNTIIDASGLISDRVFHIHSTTATVVISGVTVMNGNIDGGDGGGIYNDDADLLLINTVVRNNIASGGGGGLRTLSGSAALNNGQIVSNTANWGGGVYVGLTGSAFTQTGDSMIAYNVATGTSSSYGGGVYVYQGSAKLGGGQIISNVAGELGGGMFVYVGSAMLEGGQILSNTAGIQGGGVCVDKGAVVLSGGRIAGNVASTNKGGGVFVWQGGAFTQTGVSTITHNTAVDGGGVAVWNGWVTLEGGRILSNTASDDGGGVYVGGGSSDAAHCILNGGQILSNTANEHGGGVYVDYTSAAFTQTGVSTIIHNHANADGGGLYVNYGSAALSEGQIVSNTAGTGGGGVYVGEGSVTLSGGEVRNNTASSSGGGMYVFRGSATLNGGRVVSNTAGSDGGGVYVNRAEVMLSGGQIISNTAKQHGGGVYVNQNTAAFTQTSVSAIIHNHADNDGGGLYVNQADVTLSEGQIVSNTAAGYGGGLFVNEGSATLNGEHILSNAANGYGGGMYVDEGSAALSGGEIVSNTAQQDGGGVYVYTGTLTMLNTTLSGNRADGDGGGLYSSGSGAASAITYTTIASNTASSGGGGIHLAGGAVLLQNTIVAYNGTNCNDTLTSNGHNLDSGATCGFTAQNADPLLDPLTDENGTLVHPLPIGSPAIDEGLCLPGMTTVDQRGVNRPQGDGCDIGAYEAEMPDLTLTKSGPARFSPQERITYTLYVTNTGALTATNVVLTDTLPSGAALVVASDGGIEASGVVTWPVFSVPPGGGLVTRTFAVTATETITNADYAAAPQGLPGVKGAVVIVSSLNHAPAADAGDPQTIGPGDLVTLDGSNSQDDDGDALDYGWRQTGGTPMVTLSGAYSATATFTAPTTPGVLTFTLTVTDTFGASDAAITTVTVEEYCIYLPLVMRNHQ